MTLDDAALRLSTLAGKPSRSFSTRDFGRERYSEARSVVVNEARADKIVAELRQQLGKGLLAFIGCTSSLADGAEQGAEIVVARGDSQFDILRVAQSDAINYDMGTEDLVRKLEGYDRDFGIDIFHAETDTIEFRFRQTPADLKAFCRDLYEFCPDIVDQGAGTVAALEDEIAQQRSVYLWWD